MFYSQCLLSSKSPLGNIWVAGYFFKRLKKRQITDTNIPSSVDKILLEGLPAVTYRVLGYLLLGVVRIYSRKAEYLYQDCDQIVSDINRFSLTKKAIPFRAIVRSSCSISLPERYELDTFQLEVIDDGNRDHVSRKEDIILKDVIKYIPDQYTLGKDRFEDEPFYCEEFDDDQTSSDMSMQQNASSSMQTPEKPASDKGTSMLDHTPPDNVVSPHQMEIDVEVSSPNHMNNNFELSKEKLRDMRFSQDAELGVDMICEGDIELLDLINANDVQNTTVENKDVRDKAPLENHDHVLEKDNKVLSPVEETSDFDVADFAAETTPQFAVVPSPVVKKENLRRTNKRKCKFDEHTTLTNELIKRSINDASDLVCKRRRAPHKAIDLWRVHRVPVLLKKFLEPLIPCVALELTDIQCGRMTETQPSLDVADEPVETAPIPPKPEVVVSPRTPGDCSRAELAPGTPVRCSTSSARLFSNDRGVDSDGEGAPSDNIMKDFVHEEEDTGPILMDEFVANEDDSQEPHKNKDGWSTRTRNVAKYLHTVSQTKKQQGEEAVTLLPIVKQKTKGESARLFFEILVLSTGGFMKVTQPKPYEDVLLQETSKMEATLQQAD